MENITTIIYGTICIAYKSKSRLNMINRTIINNPLFTKAFQRFYSCISSCFYFMNGDQGGTAEEQRVQLIHYHIKLW